jgi:hypothetical protein
MIKMAKGDKKTGKHEKGKGGGRHAKPGPAVPRDPAGPWPEDPKHAEKKTPTPKTGPHY